MKIWLIILLAFACQSKPQPDEDSDELVNNSANDNNLDETFNNFANDSINQTNEIANQNSLESDFNKQNSNLDLENTKNIDTEQTNNLVKNSETVKIEPIKEEEMNRNRFLKHFKELFAGHPEANFVARTSAPIYEKASNKSQIIGYLQKGESVHGLQIENNFIKISPHKYVERASLKSMNQKTPGAERYTSTQIAPQNKSEIMKTSKEVR